MAFAVAALLALVAAVAIWRVLAPAIMSYDSMAQYRQAVSGHYDDWHPPIMAIALHYLLLAGGSIGVWTFVQCAAGLLGVVVLAALWTPAWEGRGAPPSRPLLGLLTLALLLIPLSPLPFYLMTVWKDSLAAVLFVWLFVVGAALASDAGGERAHAALLATFSLLVALLALVRHNAVVVLPLAAVFVAFAARTRGVVRRALLALLPIALFLVGQEAVDRGFEVKHMYMERYLEVADLVGLVVHRPDTWAHLDHLRRYVLVPPSELSSDYAPGAVVKPVVADEVIDDAKALRSEYLGAWRRWPRTMAAVKLEDFVGVAGLHDTKLFIYYPQVESNEFGIALSPRYADLRQRWAAVTLDTVESPFGRLLFATQWLWMVAAAGWSAFALANRRWTFGLLLLLPLAYDASYVLAAPAPDYRMMYPAALVLHTITVAWVLALPARLGRRRQGAQAAAIDLPSPRSTFST